MNEITHPAQLLFTDKHPLTSQLNMKFSEQRDLTTTVHVDAPVEFADATGTQVHTGFSTIMLDTVMGACALAELKRPMPIATIKLTSNHLRKAKVGEQLVCIAKQMNMVDEVAYVNGELKVKETGETIATAVGTFMHGTTMTPAGTKN